MKPRLPQYCLFISLFILGLTSCSTQQKTNSPATIELGTPVITETPVQNTPIPTPTITPQPTQSPTAQNTPVFLYPIDWDMANATPTAIQTPDTRSTKYRLRTWTENDAIALVNTMDQYARDVDIYGASLSRPYFEAAQQPVELLLQETINRFPESVNLDSYKWHLAQVRAIKGSDASDDWIISSLENEIQSGKVSIDSINDFLVPNGFYAVSKNADNLFGDGMTARVLQVSLNAGDKKDGIFMVVRGDQKSGFKIYKLESYWNFTNSFSFIHDFGDYHKNGITEVLINNGTMNGSQMLIFEWDGQEFTDISGGEVYFNPRDGSFAITSSTTKGPSTITIAIGSDYKIQNKYRWNGSKYEWIREDSPYNIGVWADSDSRRTHSYTREIEALKGFLASDAIKQDSSAFPDYLRYRLGVVLALESRYDEAQSEFSRLVESPSAPTYTLFPRMAKLFSSLYKDDKSLYSACMSTNRLFDKNVEYDLSYNMKTISRIEGFDIEADFYPKNLPLCDLDKALDQTLKTIPPETTNPVSFLTSSGVEIKFIKQVDLNLDGHDEWIVHLGDGFWVVVYYKNGQYFSTPLFDTMYSFVKDIDQIHVFKMPGNNQIFFTMNFADWFAIMEIDENMKIVEMVREYTNYKINIDQVKGSPVIKLNPQKHLTDNWRGEKWVGYRWNDTKKNFSNDLLENELFDQYNPEYVLNTLTEINPSFSNTNQSKILFKDPGYNYYLAALSAELSGQLEKTVEIYLQLWQSFPDSPYAIMARDKLEPVTP